MKLTISKKRTIGFTVLACAALMVMVGCDRRNTAPVNLSPGVVIEPSGMIALHDWTAKAVASAPTRVMQGNGLAGVMGGARVKLLKAGTHEVLLPIPQLTGTQVPVCYAITTTPWEAGRECRLHLREGSNAVVGVRLSGGRDQEVRIDWSSIVLIADRPVPPDLDDPEPYRQETPCVQSGAKPVRALAAALWPANGRMDGYATNIQAFIRDRNQGKQPRSMDALGILESGGNWICTANANLAAALLRARAIPARSLAVIPPIAQRLEMHRIVECFDNGRWYKFDPSSLNSDIPMKSWHSIIMARTTIADEEAAMKPRRGASPGCPCGQELEFLDGGMTLWGEDFFWTTGKPIEEFEVDDAEFEAARAAWHRFLESGMLSQEQIKAASATTAAGFRDALVR